MRTIILSFSSEWYPPLVDGRKIYEHRKRFCNEPVIAYIYLGLPRRELVAIAELGKRQLLSDWVEKYDYDKDAVSRICDYLERNRYVMEVKSFQEIEPIDMRKAEQDLNHFRVPISYMFLDDKTELYQYIKERTQLVGNKRINDFSNITSKDVCVY